MMQKVNCYCQSGKSFKTCCQPFLSGTSTPSIPEQLMRSRFSAFCTKNIDYLIATHHISKRQPNESELLLKTMNETQWLGLRIVAAKKPKNHQGNVEFIAFYKSDGFGQLHENSRFIREGDQWYYLGGQMLEPYKLSRSEPCFCGSQKKYKRCHGK